MDIQCIQNCCRVCRSINRNNDFPKLFVDDSFMELTETGVLYENLFGFCIAAETAAFYPRYLCNNCKLQLQLFQDLKSKAEQTLQELGELALDEKLCTGFVEEQNETAYEIEGMVQVLETKDVMTAESASDEMQSCGGALAVNEIELAANETELAANDMELAANDMELAGNDMELAAGVIYVQNNNSIYTIQTEVQQQNEQELYIEQQEQCIEQQEQCIEQQEQCIENVEQQEQSIEQQEQCIEQQEQCIENVEQQEQCIENVEQQEQCIEQQEQCIEQQEQCIENVEQQEQCIENVEQQELEQNNELLECLENGADAASAQETEPLWELLPKQPKLEDKISQDQDNWCDNYMIIDETQDVNEEQRKDVYVFVSNEDNAESETKHSHTTLYAEIEETESLDGQTNILFAETDYEIIEGKHICTLCHLEFEYSKDLLEHKKAEHPKHLCLECGNHYQSQAGLRLHEKMHHTEPQYKCSMCPKQFRQKSHLEYHLLNHNNVRDFECELCHKKYLAKSDLTIHMRFHNNDRRHTCDICSKKFLMQVHLKNHRYSHFGKTVICAICNMSFSSPNTLRTHINSIHKPPAFKCDKCGKLFKRKHHLQLHENIHTEPVFVDGEVSLKADID